MLINSLSGALVYCRFIAHWKLVSNIVNNNEMILKNSSPSPSSWSEPGCEVFWGGCFLWKKWQKSVNLWDMMWPVWFRTLLLLLLLLLPDQNLDVDHEVLSESRQLAACQQLLARLWLPSTTIIISLFNGQLITLQQQPFICCLHYILTVCPDRCVGLNPGQRNLAAAARWLLIFLKAWENKLPVREGCHGVSELTQQSDCSRHCF